MKKIKFLILFFLVFPINSFNRSNYFKEIVNFNDDFQKELKKDSSEVLLSDTIKVQYIINKDNTYSLRFVAGVSSTSIKAKFIRQAIYEDNQLVLKENEIEVKYAYTNINSGGIYKTAEEVFGEGYNYFIAYSLLNIPQDYIFSIIDLTLEIETDKQKLSVSEKANVEGLVKRYYNEDISFVEENDEIYAVYNKINEESIIEVEIPKFYCIYNKHVATKIGEVISIGSASLKDFGFANASYIQKVIISEGIKKLNHYSFIYCASLEEIILPNSLERIEGFTFFGLEKLQKIIIPKNVTYIGSNAFSNSNNLKIYFEVEQVLSSWHKHWNNNGGNNLLNNYYFYSENKPINEGKYWHYVDGIITEW